MSDNLTLFIAITAAAVVLQMFVLLAMYMAMRKLSAKLQSVTDETQSRLLPILDNAKAMQQEVKSFLETSRARLVLVSGGKRCRLHRPARRQALLPGPRHGPQLQHRPHPGAAGVCRCAAMV